MRLFVAVIPPRQFLDDLATRLDSVRDCLDIAWVRPENWHLTLAFLGECPADRVDVLIRRLREAVSGLGPLQLEPGAVGGFPDLKRPRVLFLHLPGGEALTILAERVRTATEADGKVFRPHLTLARIKCPLPWTQAEELGALDLGRWSPFVVDSVVLVASELHRSGARYRIVADVPLEPR